MGKRNRRVSGLAVCAAGDARMCHCHPSLWFQALVRCCEGLEAGAEVGLRATEAEHQGFG